MEEVLIITCGGTFSKVYNPIDGQMIVPENNKILERIIKTYFKFNINLIHIQEFIYKDSLDMDDNDRQRLTQLVSQSTYDKLIIIHGTDTIHLSAKEIENIAKEKNLSIVFVGAMEPISINPIEGCMNLGCAYGFLQASKTNGVFIAMNGIIKNVNEIVKNRELGYFECLK
jgi:L-asparaginase